MGRPRKTLTAYESEAVRVGDCLVHAAKTGGLARKVYQLRHGRLESSKLCVLHSCDNPHCIEDTHHFLGTQQENVADMMRKNRNAKLAGAAHPMYGRTRADTSERNRNFPPAKGHRQSSEHREKIADAQIRAWQRRKALPNV